MNLPQAIDHVKGILLAAWNDKTENSRVEIHLWDTSRLSSAVGVRVSEISFIETFPNSTSGSSFMQCDSSSFEACFTVERAILSLTESDALPPGDAWDSTYSMLRAIFEEEVAREWAEANPYPGEA